MNDKSKIVIPDPTPDKNIMCDTLNKLKDQVQQFSHDIGIDLDKLITSMEGDLNDFLKQ